MGAWVKRLVCWLRFHDLIVLREFGTSRQCYCRRCERMFGMHDGARAFIPWDAELEEMYKFLGKM